MRRAPKRGEERPDRVLRADEADHASSRITVVQFALPLLKGRGQPAQPRLRWTLHALIRQAVAPQAAEVSAAGREVERAHPPPAGLLFGGEKGTLHEPAGATEAPRYGHEAQRVTEGLLPDRVGDLGNRRSLLPVSKAHVERLATPSGRRRATTACAPAGTRLTAFRTSRTRRTQASSTRPFRGRRPVVRAFGRSLTLSLYPTQHLVRRVGEADSCAVAESRRSPDTAREDWGLLATAVGLHDCLARKSYTPSREKGPGAIGRGGLRPVPLQGGSVADRSPHKSAAI